MELRLEPQLSRGTEIEKFSRLPRNRPIVNIMGIPSQCDRPIGIESSSREAPVDENGAREEEEEEEEEEERFQLSTPATVVVGSSVPRMVYVVSIPTAKRVELIK